MSVASKELWDVGCVIRVKSCELWDEWCKGMRDTSKELWIVRCGYEDGFAEVLNRHSQQYNWSIE